jgi:hypothetical protein
MVIHTAKISATTAILMIFIQRRSFSHPQIGHMMDSAATMFLHAGHFFKSIAAPLPQALDGRGFYHSFSRRSKK